MFSIRSTRKTSSSSKFEALLNEACAEYTKQTGVNLFDYLHASKIDNCKSAEELLDIFQEQAKEFEEFRVHDPRLFKCLRPVVDGLDKLSPGVKAVTVAATDSISKVSSHQICSVRYSHRVGFPPCSSNLFSDQHPSLSAFLLYILHFLL